MELSGLKTFRGFIITLIILNSVGYICTRTVQEILDLDEEDLWLSDESNYEDIDYLADSPPKDGNADGNDGCGPVPEVASKKACKAKVCSGNTDCRKKNERCCFNGCVKTCITQQDPPPIIDWIRQPRPRTRSGVSWLVNGPSNDKDLEPCSTTAFEDNADPLLCPHGYICHVINPGRPKKGIPNRGYCIRENDQIFAVPSETKGENTQQGTFCLTDKYLLADGAYMTFRGKKCYCKEGFLTCLSKKG